jgi:hypothetical protein
MLRKLFLAALVVVPLVGACTTLAGLEEDAAEIRELLREDQLKLMEDRRVAWELYDGGEITLEEYLDLMEQTDEFEQEARERAEGAVDDALEDAKDRIEREKDISKERGKSFVFSLLDIIIYSLLGGVGVGALSVAGKSTVDKRKAAEPSTALEAGASRKR